MSSWTSGASVQLTRFGGTLDLDLLNLLDARYPELRASGFINPGAPFTLRAAFRARRSVVLTNPAETRPCGTSCPWCSRSS